MPHRIVNGLKAVEIDKQQGNGLIFPTTFFQHDIQPFMQLAAVGQAGERIVIGQPVNALFNDFAFGNIRHNDDQTLNFMVGIADGADSRPAGTGFAIGFLIRNFTLPVTFNHQRFADGTEKVIIMTFRGDQYIRRAAQYIGGGVAGNSGEGLVEFNDAQILIGNENGFVTIGEYFGGQLQFALQHAGFANITANTDNTLQLAIIIPERAGLQFQ